MALVFSEQSPGASLLIGNFVNTWLSDKNPHNPNRTHGLLESHDPPQGLLFYCVGIGESLRSSFLVFDCLCSHMVCKSCFFQKKNVSLEAFYFSERIIEIYRKQLLLYIGNKIKILWSSKIVSTEKIKYFF